MSNLHAAGLSHNRYGQPACDCGHRWVKHDAHAHPGDGTETCSVPGCDQQGCPGRKRQPEHRMPDDGDLKRIVERLRAL